MALRRIGDKVVAKRRERPEQTRQIASEAREAERRDIGRFKRAVSEIGHGAGIAAGTVDEQDAVASVLVPDFAHLGLQGVEGLVPCDALPLVLATLTRAFHGILQAVGVIHRLGQVEAAHAQLAVHERAERIALHAFELAVPHVQQKPA